MSRQRNEILMKRYGIDQEDYDRMLEEQGGVCAICTKPPGIRGLFVDHNHDTNEVRGLLCGSCNTGLGFFRDKALNLYHAIQYLTRGK